MTLKVNPIQIGLKCLKQINIEIININYLKYYKTKLKYENIKIYIKLLSRRSVNEIKFVDKREFEMLCSILVFIDSL